jgi:flagellar assembly protein FliH
MSKLLDCDAPGDCKTWQAPQFDNTSGGGSLVTRQQQQRLEQDAYEQGFSKGYQEGLEQAQNEINQHIHHLQSLAATLATPLADLDKQVVDELVDLSMAVARQIIRRELKTSPGEIVAVIKEALSLLPVTATDVRLELHPEDAALVRNALLGSDGQAPWQIIEDPVLSRGGCRVSTSTSRIDATVENRINVAIAAVIGCEREVD